MHKRVVIVALMAAVVAGAGVAGAVAFAGEHSPRPATSGESPTPRPSRSHAPESAHPSGDADDRDDADDDATDGDDKDGHEGTEVEDPAERDGHPVTG